MKFHVYHIFKDHFKVIHKYNKIESLGQFKYYLQTISIQLFTLIIENYHHKLNNCHLSEKSNVFSLQ